MKARGFFTILSTFLLVVIPIGLQAQTSPWPMFRHDYKHTGRTAYTGPADTVQYWTYQTNDGIVSSPSIGHDGTIYVGAGWLHSGASDSGLYAINPDGSLKWKYVADDGIFSSPFIGPDGTIYFGCIDTDVYAVEDSGTYGKLKWRTDLGPFFILGSPSLAPDGNVYVGAPDFNFYTLDSANGEILWQFKAGWCYISTPAIGDDGIIYIGSKDHRLYAFDPVAQDTAWAFPTGAFYDGHLVDASPAIGDDGTLYVGTDQYGAAGQTPVPVDTSFWAVNPDGSKKWNLYIGDGVESSPALGADGTIYFGSYDSVFYAVGDSGTYGDIKWTYPTHGSIDGSPTIDGDGNIYFGSRDSTLYCLYPDGNLRWSVKLGGDIESSPTIDGNGYLYIGCFDGKLYCFGTGGADVGAVSVDIPSVVTADAMVTPKASLRNFRSAERTFDVAFHVDSLGVRIYTDTTEAILGDAAVQQVSFAAWQVGPDGNAVYDFIVETLDAGDENAENNGAASSAVTIAYACGDANGDDAVNVGDAVYLINYAFKGGPAPDPLLAGDANCDAAVNVGDAVYLINYAFKGGPPPCASCP